MNTCTPMSRATDVRLVDLGRRGVAESSLEANHIDSYSPYPPQFHLPSTTSSTHNVVLESGL